MASLVQLKMNYHSLHDNPITICANLPRSWLIHKALERNQDAALVGKEKENVSKVNISNLNKRLEVIAVGHHSRGHTSPNKGHLER